MVSKLLLVKKFKRWSKNDHMLRHLYIIIIQHSTCHASDTNPVIVSHPTIVSALFQAFDTNPSTIISHRTTISCLVSGIWHQSNNHNFSSHNRMSCFTPPKTIIKHDRSCHCTSSNHTFSSSKTNASTPYSPRLPHSNHKCAQLWGLKP
jgi:hypothetical protein